MATTRGQLTGSRIRARRQAAGLRQGALAREVGISPSYLNLIEHNRRRIGGQLLGKIAAALGTDRASLAEGAEAALIGALQVAAARDAGTPAPDLDRLEEFAGRFPGWAGLIARQQDRIGAHEETIAALSDRLAHDPFLADTMHEALNTASAIRATASILARTPDLEPARRGRFHTNLFQDAQRLAETMAALVTWLNRAGDARAAGATPTDALAEFVAAHDNHFPTIEAGGDPAALVAGDPHLPDNAARALALAWLRRVAEDARALPLDRFVARGRVTGFDPAALAADFGAPLDAVLRRLGGLPAGPHWPAFGLAICDGSGTLLLRKPLPAFPLPRYGAACPLWPLFQALLRPGMPVAATIDMPEGARLVAHALCTLAAAADFGGPQRAEAVMCVRRVDAAADDGPQPVVPAGTSCRVCPRPACPARREPALI
jgi:transcriptional regulator with XRE-family HTH domain